MNAVVSSVDHYVAEFAKVKQSLPGAQLAWLSDAREQALKDFAFPGRRDEDWKYTSTAPLEKHEFRLPVEPGALPSEQLAGLALPDFDCYQMVFVDGRFDPDSSQLDGLNAGIQITSLSHQIAQDPDSVTELLNVERADRHTSFAKLNTAFFTDGACIVLEQGAQADKPIQLLFVVTTDGLIQHPRIVIRAAANSAATIVERYVGIGTGKSFTNTRTTLDAGPNAHIEHYKIQDEPLTAFHVGNLNLRQGRDSEVISHSISLGARLARNDINVELNDSGARVSLNGLYIASGRQHVDNHTRVDHLQPHTTSDEYYRGVLNGRARGVFNGKVVVHKDAQKTDASQANNNLLLSGDAEIDTKPELEIYADDVKCAHGCTVGQLDKNALFYLRSRGLDENTATTLLTFAFADDVIARVNVPEIRRHLETRIAGQLPNAAILREFV